MQELRNFLEDQGIFLNNQYWTEFTQNEEIVSLYSSRNFKAVFEKLLESDLRNKTKPFVPADINTQKKAPYPVRIIQL